MDAWRERLAHHSGDPIPMPMIDADGCLLNVYVEGRDGGPTLMLANSLSCTLQMWEPQMKALTQLFRVIRYDRRGHGKSSVPPGPLFDGAIRPRRPGDPRRPQHREGALVLIVDGRHGRTVARRQCAGAARQDHSFQHRLLLSRSDQL